MTEPQRPEDRPGGMRFPDATPFRRIQLVTAGLIVVVIVLTLTSGSRPAEVRWGTLIGLAAVTVAVFVTYRRRRSRRPSADDQNTRNTGEIGKERREGE